MAENVWGKSSRSFSWEKLLAIFILLAAFFLYTHNLTAEGLWRDEGLSYTRAMQPVLQIFKGQNIVQGNITPDLHPPGYFLMLKAVIALAGKSEFVLRLPSVFAAVLAVATVGRLAHDLITRKAFASPLSMLVVVSSPFVYWYARETRMYSLLMLGVALFYWRLMLLVRKQKSGEVRFTADWLPLILAGLLLLATHISAVFVIAFAILVLFLRIPSRQLQIPLAILVAIGVGFGALSLTEWGISMLSTQFDFFSPRPFGKLLAETTTTFSLGGAIPPDTVRPLFAFFILLATLGIVLPIVTNGTATAEKSLDLLLPTVFALLIPLLLFYIASFIRPGYSNPRHLTILAIPWFLTISTGMLAVYKRLTVVGILLGLGVVLIGGGTIGSHITQPPIIKDQLREMNVFLDDRVLPGDTLLFHQPALMTPWEYYEVENINTIGYPRWAALPYSELELEFFLREAEVSDRIWFVDTFGRESNIKDWLTENWQAQKGVNFDGSWKNLSVTLYLPPESKLGTTENSLIDEPLESGAFTLDRLIEINQPVSNRHYWVNAEWSSTAADDVVCLVVETQSNEYIDEDCHQPETRPDMTNTIGFGLNLPPGLQDETYQLRIRGSGKLSRPIPITVAPAQLAAEDAVYQQGDFLLFKPQPIGTDFFPGGWVTLNAIWQLASPNDASQPLETAWRLTDRRQQNVIDTVESVDVSAFATGQPLRFQLPPDATGTYRLQLQTNSGRWKTVSQIDVTQWPFASQSPENVLWPNADHQFAEEFSIDGYQLERHDNQLTVTLFWQADDKPADDWVVFIHVGEPGTPPVTQTVNRPDNGTRPTEGWRLGEVIKDPHTVILPADLTAEQSKIMVGLYLASDPSIRAGLTVNDDPKADNILVIDEVPNP
ncbi:MAG: glycosyltransferase family 39 protein [Anaerolineae bacterium]